MAPYKFQQKVHIGEKDRHISLRCATHAERDGDLKEVLNTIFLRIRGLGDSEGENSIFAGAGAGAGAGQLSSRVRNS